MKDIRWRSAGLLVAAALGLGLPARAVAADKPDDSSDKKQQHKKVATGEEQQDSDVPTPSQMPRPPAPPSLGNAAESHGPKRQAAMPALPGTQLTLAPGDHYRANGLHSMLMGRHYRAAWATPVPVNVLDLRTYGGGLKPVKKGGGRQTLSLTFEAPDGRRYKFRSTDKDPGPALEPKLRETLAETVLHDQISASHPGSPLVVDALTAAAGLPYVAHEMVVLPDDDGLGEFRQQFAGQFGMIEPVADEDHPLPPGFEGVTRVVETDRLFERIDADPKERVDARSYLKARLFDMFVGDWDRHERQWEWIQRGKDAPFQAYPVDRDLAFIQFDGLLPGLMKGAHPMLVTFGPLYPKVLGLAWNSRVLDRRLLGGLELSAYHDAARELQLGLTDAAIEEAVHRLPQAWFAINGEHFITSLKSRRDRLPQIAEAFYHLLAGEVEGHGTNAAETVEVRREEPGSLLVVVRNEGSPEPLLQRRFRDGDTREVRLYLKGGDDEVRTIGTTGDGIDLRVAGGPGNDVVDDSQGGGTGLYDHEGKNRVVDGRGTTLNTHYWVQPTDLGGFPLRDWGGGSSLGPAVSAGQDLGVLIGARWQHKDYGFRRLPYSSLQTVRLGYSTGRRGWRGEYIGDFMHTASYREHQVRALLSDIELVRFYGFGNETAAGRPSEFFRAEQRQYMLSPSYRWGSRTTGIWLGAVGRFSDTKLQPNTFIEQQRPYGVEDFGQVGPLMRFGVAPRAAERAPTRGLLLEATGIYYPQVWSVDRQFGDTHGEANAFLPMGPFTLALRAGGKKVWGDLIPFHEAAYIGGPGTVRGLRRNRYAGDASAFGTTELRLRLGTMNVLLPIDVGVFGFGDIGRVFVKGQTSDVWHTGVGGGLSLAFVYPENTVTLGVAWPGTLEDGRFRKAFDGDNRPRFYLTGGFTF
jgi:hypothetical protein